MNKNVPIEVEVPQEMPFLKAVCWDLHDISVLSQSEILSRYERSWDNLGALADLGTEERAYVAKIAKCEGSWLQVHV